MQKVLLSTTLLFILLLGCSSSPEIIPDTKMVSFVTNGIWIGMLSCADCEEIDYQLNLKNNFTFKQKRVYRGKSEQISIDDGSWEFVSDSVISVNGSNEKKLFLIRDKNLVILNKDGEKTKSSYNEKYYLHKDPTTVKEIKEVEEINNVKPTKEPIEMNSDYYQQKYLNGVDFLREETNPTGHLKLILKNL